VQRLEEMVKGREEVEAEWLRMGPAEEVKEE